MPRLNVNYEKTILYKIVCNDLNIKDLYVGQTTDFAKRKNHHKNHSNKIIEGSRYYNFKVYRFIRANGGWDNWDIIEIEKFPCKDKNEAHARERFWIESLQATLNGVIPLRTTAEYIEANKESIALTVKKYNIANYERTHEKFNCACGGKYTLQGISIHFKSNRHLAFIENPDFLRIKKLASRDRLLEKFNCPCGGRYIFTEKLKHFKTQKHIKYLDTIEPLALAI